MLNQRESFILVQNPVLPFLGTVGHGTQDNLGDLETRVSKSEKLASVPLVMVVGNRIPGEFHFVSHDVATLL